eukprot:CAMPEP_0119368782 /NCGR_PEP_ID=MMETSP1334-20130426/15399_1 /TAXON_ID=127549 /ORGANISM="Calcidiscus leptoporus, Strain RCC1130" /LENGTH=447 /DNA_ID=CAMNT_0007385497 /DNA_START=54 /DNA_END=1397 /DNA_ORIENTATION=+
MDRRDARALQQMMLLMANQRLAEERRTQWRWRFWEQWWYDWCNDPAGTEESPILKGVWWLFSAPWKLVVAAADASAQLILFLITLVPPSILFSSIHLCERAVSGAVGLLAVAFNHLIHAGQLLVGVGGRGADACYQRRLHEEDFDDDRLRQRGKARKKSRPLRPTDPAETVSMPAAAPAPSPAVAESTPCRGRHSTSTKPATKATRLPAPVEACCGADVSRTGGKGVAPAGGGGMPRGQKHGKRAHPPSHVEATSGHARPVAGTAGRGLVEQKAPAASPKSGKPSQRAGGRSARANAPAPAAVPASPVVGGALVEVEKVSASHVESAAPVADAVLHRDGAQGALASGGARVAETERGPPHNVDEPAHTDDEANGTDDEPTATLPARALTANQQDSRLCVICIERERSHIFLPCYHYCVCAMCVAEFKLPAACPMCRITAKAVHRVYD